MQKLKTKRRQFLRNKRAQNENTYKSYKTSLKYFFQYLKEYEINRITDENKRETLDGFKTYLNEGFIYDDGRSKEPKNIKLKASGINSNLKRARTFLNYIGFPVTSTEVSPLPVNAPDYKALRFEDINKLINNAPLCFRDKEKALRIQTLIKLLFNTGLRIGEALPLKIEDMHQDRNTGQYYLNFHEKGKARGVYSKIVIPAKTHHDLKYYIENKAIKESPYIFTASRGYKGKAPGHVTRQSFNNDIIKLAKFTDKQEHTNIFNIVNGNSSHVFRHSRAVYLLTVEKRDIMEVRDILRHKNINTTQIYLKPREDIINNIRENTGIL